jgi:hypothetical protein
MRRTIFNSKRNGHEAEHVVAEPTVAEPAAAEPRVSAARNRRALALASSLALVLLAVASLAAGAFAPPAPPAPPTPPAPTITARPSDPSNQTSARFAYSDGQSGVSYQCQLDGASFSSCPAGAISYAGPLAQGSHTFKVRALAGSKTGPASSYSWTVDTVAPSAAISYPSNGLTLAASDWDAHCPGRASLCGSASDASGVAAVLVSIQRSGGNWWGGSAFNRTSEYFGSVALSRGDHNTTRWSYTLPLPADGAYVVHVRASDEAGNTTSAAAQTSATFTIDTTPPPLPAITTKPEATTTAKSATFGFSDGEPGARFQCRHDGGRFSACSSPQSYSSLSLGSHRFEVEAIDAVGNTSSPAGYTWTVAKAVEESGKPFTVTGNASGPLAPGVSRTLAITVTNPNNVAIEVTSLTASVAAGSSKAGCDGPTNLQLTQSNISSSNALSIPANGHVALPASAITAPVVQMRDLSTNQDACKGASFSFTYSGSAHS